MFAACELLANDISRQLVGIPFTRTEQDEIRAQKKGLAPEEIDRNAYRQSTKRSYVAAAIVDMPDDVAVIIDYFLGLGLSTAAASIVVVIG